MLSTSNISTPPDWRWVVYEDDERRVVLERPNGEVIESDVFLGGTGAMPVRAVNQREFVLLNRIAVAVARERPGEAFTKASYRHIVSTAAAMLFDRPARLAASEYRDGVVTLRRPKLMGDAVLILRDKDVPVYFIERVSDDEALVLTMDSTPVKLDFGLQMATLPYEPLTVQLRAVAVARRDAPRPY